MSAAFNNHRFQLFLTELKKMITSEVKTDDLSLGLYATDASLYQLLPLAVVIPKNESDLIILVKLANEYNIPILARGSATSLAGQTTNEAIIVDFTKYFNHIIEIIRKDDMTSFSPESCATKLMLP